jgi:CubicO group peptidase (beta-lactamase class C family)
MARFLSFHMGTNLPGQQQVLSRKTLAAMQRPASSWPMPAPGEPRRDLGANWIISTINGHPQLWHTGGQPGVSAYMSFYPDQKLGIVLLANSSAPLGRVSQAIRTAIAPEILPPVEGPLPPPQAIPFRGTWEGVVTNSTGQVPIVLTFLDSGEIDVRLADQERTTLQRKAFANGALTGLFNGSSNLPEAKGHPHQLAIDVVQAGDELVGQLVAQGMDGQTAFMLPSFVRLRSTAAATLVPGAKQP